MSCFRTSALVLISASSLVWFAVSTLQNFRVSQDKAKLAIKKTGLFDYIPIRGSYITDLRFIKESYLRKPLISHEHLRNSENVEDSFVKQLLKLIEDGGFEMEDNSFDGLF